MKVSVFTLLFALVLSPSGAAQQLFFARHFGDEQIKLDYQWLHDGQEQSMSVNLDRQVLFDLFRQVKGYRQDFLLQKQYVALLNEVRRQNLSPAQARINKNDKSIDVAIRLGSQEETQALHQQLIDTKRDVTQDYLLANYLFIFDTVRQKRAIFPDHVRYIQDSATVLAPVVETLRQQINSNNPRDIINYVLAWVQSIPYDTLENRKYSNGNGYEPPNQVLLNNRGDCDSKVVLASVILQGLMPSRNVAVVYLADHALLGIALRPQGQEKNVRLDGLKYVLAEPTGPARLNVGELAESSEIAILNQQYTWRIAQSQPD